MVISSTAIDEVEEVIPSTEFYWYATRDDFDDEGNLTVNISTGRLRHRWVPITKSSAKIYIREYDEAAGIRSKGDDLFLVKIYSRDIENVSEKYPDVGPEGLTGIVIKTPIEVTVPQRGRWGDPPPHFTIGWRTDIINTRQVVELSGLQTGIMSDDDILNMSVMEVLNPEAFQDDGKNTPIVDGVHDLRMGTTDTGTECQTCGRDMDINDAAASCPGHFGHIELTTPIPKILYLGVEKRRAKKNYPLLFTLNHVCHSCHKIQLPDELLYEILPKLEQQFELGGRNKQAYDNIRSILGSKFASHWKNGRKPCPHCDEFTPEVEFSHSPYPEFYIHNPDSRYRKDLGVLVKKLGFETVREIFSNIPPDQARLFGFDPEFAHPQDMFWGILPISPVTMRPSVMIPGKKDLQVDDLTKLYQDVIYANNNLRLAIQRGWGVTSIEKNTTRLYFAVSRVVDNRIHAIGSGGTALERSYQGGEKSVSFKGIMNRFTGKTGRFRTNLQSKYVEDVGYSAVAPSGDLAIDEVGVPIDMCKRIGIEEKVTLENIKRLREMVLNGGDKYPGALAVCLDGNTYNKKDNWLELVDSREASRERVSKHLEVGSVVKRHVIKGDVGLFNRAPSLHRQSIMALRAIPLDQKNLSFNATICDPFNADFDGDAMKFHFVQKEEALAEARQYMDLTKNIIHARYGKLAVANDQDQVSGIYLLTHTNKRRKGEWNATRGLGFTEEGIPYISHARAKSAFSTVYSFDRKKGVKRHVTSLPEEVIYAPDGTLCCTGRAMFSHLFTVLDCEYVSAKFQGNTPQVDEEGNILRDEKGKGIPEVVIFENGKLLQGTLEKNAFGTGGASIAPSFIYHEGYEKGQAKLVEFIEMSTRLGLAGHKVIGFTMGVADVKGGPETQARIDERYEITAEKIRKVQDAWDNKTLRELADNHDQEIYADMDPLGFMEEKVYALTEEYEKEILGPIQDYQGAGNPMQISVRSKARGSDSNVQQMGGSYGLMMVGGRRVRSGLQPNRVLPHFPSGDNHPKYSGFIKSSYSSGMEPTEYWMGSTGGRRSTVESGMGNIAKSGYLERKMIKGIESYVVDKQLRVVNLRTNRIVSPIVGEDGLKAWHIRGDHAWTNKKGKQLTLQPLFYDYKCKHDRYLANDCEDCTKGSDVSFFIDEVAALSKGQRIKPSNKSTNLVANKLGVREVTKPNVRKMAKKYVDFYIDSLCRPGEAIGAVAAACIGEPATQAALRTFHFAGKVSFQGSIDRVVQIFESPMKKGNEQHNPQTVFRFKEGVTEKQAAKVANTLRTVLGHRVISLVRYDLEDNAMVVELDWDKMHLYRIHRETLVKRFNKVTKGYGGELVLPDLTEEFNLKILMSTNDSQNFLYLKEALMGTAINGLGGTEFEVYLKQPKDDPEGKGRYWLDIRFCGDAFLNSCDRLLSDVIDFDISNTTNLGWIHKKYGLEAALMSICDQIDFQMNGGGGAKGIGEYDWRYIRTIADIMGESGELTKLGPYGVAAFNNPSMIGGCSLERQWPIIMSSALMGQFDPLNGVAESVASGKTVKIGNHAPNDL